MELAAAAAPLLRGAGGAALPGLAAAALSGRDGAPSFLQLAAAPQMADGAPALARPAPRSPRDARRAPSRAQASS